MDYIFKNISYELPGAFSNPVILAEVEILPENTADWRKVYAVLNTRSFEQVQELEKMFNSRPSLPNIKNVYFNNPVSVVLWDDGTKTIVKCQDGDTYSRETGLALCMAKKAMGNKGAYNDIFKKWIPEEKKDSSYVGDCSSCKYCSLSFNESPCCECAMTKWEPAERPN